MLSMLTKPQTKEVMIKCYRVIPSQQIITRDLTAVSLSYEQNCP